MGGLLSAPAYAQTIGASPVTALHQSLHLTPQQEPAWKAYRDAAAVPAKAQGRRQAASKMFPSLTSPQRMDLIDAEMRQEMQDFKAQSEALKAFYGTLSPDQKRIFDKQTLPPRGDQDPSQ
jgi:hypothetical protein